MSSTQRNRKRRNHTRRLSTIQEETSRNLSPRKPTRKRKRENSAELIKREASDERRKRLSSQEANRRLFDRLNTIPMLRFRPSSEKENLNLLNQELKKNSPKKNKGKSKSLGLGKVLGTKI